MKKLKFILSIFVNFVIDIYYIFSKLTIYDVLDTIQLIGFGLLVNGIYGFYTNPNLKDFILIVIVICIILTVKQSSKDQKWWKLLP